MEMMELFPESGDFQVDLSEELAGLSALLGCGFETTLPCIPAVLLHIAAYCCVFREWSL